MYILLPNTAPTVALFDGAFVVPATSDQFVLAFFTTAAVNAVDPLVSNMFVPRIEPTVAPLAGNVENIVPVPLPPLTN